MRAQVGILLCMLAAGCASAPADRLGFSPSNPETNELPVPNLGISLTVGVEFLPRESIIGHRESIPVQASKLPWGTAGWDETDTNILVESALPWTEARTLPARGRTTEDNRKRTFWELSEDELALVDCPVERMTLMFLHGLMGQDRRRLQRELGMPLLASQHYDLSARLLESLEDPLAQEERARFLSRNGNRLLSRPFRRALKNTSFIHDLELLVEDFKAENVITSQSYREHNDDGIDWGHVSVRVHLTHFYDPVELTYSIRGLRVGSSQGKFKLGWTERLAEDLYLHVRTRHAYGSGLTTVRSDVIWEYDPQTIFAVVGGNDLNFLASSDAYSFFESPMDGASGVLFYAQHIF